MRESTFPTPPVFNWPVTISPINRPLDAEDFDRMKELVDRQDRWVWLLMTQGKTYEEIAAEIGVSAAVVNNTLAALRRKLGIKNNVQLALAAIRYHMVKVEQSPMPGNQEIKGYVYPIAGM